MRRVIAIKYREYRGYNRDTTRHDGLCLRKDAGEGRRCAKRRARDAQYCYKCKVTRALYVVYPVDYFLSVNGPQRRF